MGVKGSETVTHEGDHLSDTKERHIQRPTANATVASGEDDKNERGAALS